MTVGLVAAKHSLSALAQAARVGKVQQQPQRLIGDAVFGIVQIQAHCITGQAFAALRIIGKQLAQMGVFNCFVMRC